MALVTTVAGLAGLQRYYATGDPYGVVTFFRYPNAFFTLLFAGTEVGFSWYARRQFLQKDTLRSAWTLLSLSAMAHFAGRLLNVIGSAILTDTASSAVSEAGQVIGGPLQFALLLLGLIRVASRFRRLALCRHLKKVDYLLLASVGALTIRTLLAIPQWLAAGSSVTWSRILLWTSDPLLLSLLVVAIFIRRGVASLGHGILANCWRSYAAAIVLTSFASATLWCTSCSGFPLWNSLGWYVWLLADAAFALGPAFQVAAVERVQMGTRILREIGLANGL